MARKLRRGREGKMRAEDLAESIDCVSKEGLDDVSCEVN